MNCNQWARELGVDAITLSKRLTREGLAVGPGETYDTCTIFRSWVGNRDEALARRANAEAELTELQAAEKRGEVMDRPTAEGLIRSWLLPVRELLVACPEELAARLNPSDPEHARVHLIEWRDRALRIMGGKEGQHAET
jgi:hypothetical protein